MSRVTWRRSQSWGRRVTTSGRAKAKTPKRRSGQPRSQSTRSIGGVVGPVEVLDEEDQRALLGAHEGLERHAQARLHELRAGARGAEGLVGVVGEGDADELADEGREEAQRAREPRRDVGADLVDLVLRRIAVVHAHQRAEGAAERREAAAAAHRIAAAEEHLRAARRELEPLHQLGSHAALADAGGAGDERGARRPVLDQLGEDALEQGDFLLAADRGRDAAEELARAEAARVLAQEHAALAVFLDDEAALDRRGGVACRAARRRGAAISSWRAARSSASPARLARPRTAWPTATVTRAEGMALATARPARAARMASSPLDRSTPSTATMRPPASASKRVSSPSTSRTAASTSGVSSAPPRS